MQFGQPLDLWMYWNSNNPLSVGSILLDAANEKSGWILQAPDDLTITDVEVQIRSVTTGATLNVRVETVDLSTGYPSGSLLATNTSGTITVTGSDTNTWKTCALTAGATVSRGQLFAVVVANPGTSFGNLQLWQYVTCSMRYGPGLQQVVNGLGAAGAWNGRSGDMGLLALKDANGYLCWPGLLPVDGSEASVSLGTATTPDEAGNLFQLPLSCDCVGFVMTKGTGAQDWDVVLYDGSNNVLASRTVDKDVDLSAYGRYVNLWDDPVALAADTNYRLVVKATSSTSAGATYELTASGRWSAFPLGTDCRKTSRTDGGSWTEDATKRISIYPLLDNFALGNPPEPDTYYGRGTLWGPHGCGGSPARGV